MSHAIEFENSLDEFEELDLFLDIAERVFKSSNQKLDEISKSNAIQNRGERVKRKLPTKRQRSIADFFNQRGIPNASPEPMDSSKKENLDQSKRSNMILIDGMKNRMAENSTKTGGRTKVAVGSLKKIKGFKFVSGTNFVVDAFAHGPLNGVKGYFLSHFHSDHYRGLNEKFCHGQIYCSTVTANLIEQELGVKKGFVTRLDIGKLYIIGKVHVGLIDANQ